MDEIDSVIGLNYIERDKEGREVARVYRRINGEGCHLLDNVLQEVLYFLNAAGYPYVETLVAIGTNGGEVVTKA